MSPSLPRCSGREVVRALERAGFALVSQHGSHAKLRHAGGRTVIVPMHRELATGTLRSVLEQDGLSQVEFRALL